MIDKVSPLMLRNAESVVVCETLSDELAVKNCETVNAIEDENEIGVDVAEECEVTRSCVEDGSMELLGDRDDPRLAD